MSYVQLVSPLLPGQLDELLSMGWYRMQQHVFTTHAIHLEEEIVPVFWARILLQDYKVAGRHQKLSRMNRRFSLTLHEAVIDGEIEALFAEYRAGIDFDTGPKVSDILLERDSTTNFFPSKMWQVRDGGRLIAVGYFDEGAESAAGILNFFHPDYRKYSLGLWLYLENLRYAVEAGRRYFYPGYIALNFPKFDYKLLAGEEHTELFDAHRSRWIPYDRTIHAARRRPAG